MASRRSILGANKRSRRWLHVWTVIAFALLLGGSNEAAGGEHSGEVTFGGLPVPGVTVSAASGDRQLVTTTDERGRFELPDASAGVWTIRVEMLGFETLTREVTVAAAPQPSTWTLTLKAFDDIARGAAAAPPAAANAQRLLGSTPSAVPASAPAAGGARGQGGFQRATAASPPVPVNPRPAADESAGDPDATASDGFLINGSVNNGAASPFAQAAAFGNNRRTRGSLFNYSFAVSEGNSALDARPFTFGGQPVAKPDYNDLHLAGTFGGPLRFSHVLRNGPVVFAGFQRTDNHFSTTQPGVMPTALERAGDLSQSRDPFGQPIQIRDPRTGEPFPGNTIPAARISPQAAALIGYYPLPNVADATGYNFQAPLLTATEQNLLTTRVTQAINNRNQLIGAVGFQHTTTDQTSVFGFTDASVLSGIDTSVTWTRVVTRALSLRPRAQFTQLSNHVTPYFAGRTNVSSLAGVTGNNQDPENWGPPALAFSSITALTDALPNVTHNQTYGGGLEGFWSRGRHNLTLGGDLKRNAVNVRSQQNPRGTWTFSGALSGSDLAEFLLGYPSTSAIATGNADKYFRSVGSDAYISDDWRVSPTLTMQIGARWEYDTPPTELYGRLVNLAVAPDFSAAAPIHDSLLHPDRHGLQPRVATAWRPVPGSSLVVRAGYGVYRNTGVYQPVITLLAQQPPLSNTYTIATSAAAPLALADGFAAPQVPLTNTFAVDPFLRIGEVHNWQALVQRDLPASLTVIASYFGTKGFDLPQEFLPNTYPLGAPNPCAACPSGFVYLASHGSSTRQAGQLQLRRRLRGGLAGTVQYTLAEAVDNATAFAGVNLTGAAIAQDWQNLDAERGPSNFDQRHQVTAQLQYTTGMGVGGGTLLDGMKGRLWKGWTMTGALTAGSGLPFTPVVLTPPGGSGVTGSVRPSLTSAQIAAPGGYYLNPAAYGAPAPGQWGTAKRNSVEGPSQFTFNMGLARTFELSQRASLDWRVDATNVLNRLTYTGVNAIVGGPQFGLPNAANTPRKILMTLRMRFSR
jgi:hypothetical protein